MYVAWTKLTTQGEVTFTKEGAPEVGFVYTMKSAGRIVRELNHSNDLTCEAVEQRFFGHAATASVGTLTG